VPADLSVPAVQSPTAVHGQANPAGEASSEPRGSALCRARGEGARQHGCRKTRKRCSRVSAGFPCSRV